VSELALLLYVPNTLPTADRRSQSRFNQLYSSHLAVSLDGNTMLL
jgi:hypothetical protein